MHRLWVWLIVGLIGVSVTSSDAVAKIAMADLYNPDGARVGVATFVEGHDGVTVLVALQNMPPGTHALHIHGAASCEAPHFKSAGGHFNPFERKHGLRSADGPHAGDLQNIVIGADGTGTFVRTAPLVTLGDGPGSLFREGGTALMIHEGPDDYVSDPAGNAGARIACGIIRPIE